MTLKDIAAAELAWAMAREETYKNDGGTVPEPIRRLKALAAEVQDAPVAETSVASPLAVAVRDAGSRLGIAGAGAEDADLRGLVAEIEKRAANGAEVRDVIAKCDRALQDGSEVLLGVARALGRLFIAGDGRVLPSGESASAPAEERIQLRHGLLLKQRKTGHRALFSEVKEGEFVYQWIAPDGHSATDPEPAPRDNWTTNTWDLCSDRIDVLPVAAFWCQSHTPDNPSATATPTNPMVPPADKPADASPGLIRDWNPSADEMNKKAGEFAAAMQKAGLTVAIDVPRLVERFKTEKGAERTQKPAMAFYHWGVKTLKGS